MKEKLLNQLNLLVEGKIDSLNKAINETIESRDSNTKSSAGDKHETSRAMMQIELENLSMQLKKNNVLKYELSKIDLTKKYNEIKFGSLVFTDQGNYFISIGVGRIVLNNKSFYCISMGSPIGKCLCNKKTGDILNFMDKKIEVKKIL